MATDEYDEDVDDLLDDEEADDDEDVDLDLSDDELEIDDLDVGDDVDVDEDEDVDEEEDEDEEEDVDEDEDVDEEAEESLDVLLAREQGDDDALVRLDDEPRDGLVAVTEPIAADEFTCTSCFLVKRRAQLADEKKMICLDCA